MGLLGGLGKLIKKVANTKVMGVSLGGGIGAASGGLAGMLGGQLARGGNIKQNVLGDLKAGVGNTAKIFPMAKALGGTSVTGGEPSVADDGGYDPMVRVTSQGATPAAQAASDAWGLGEDSPITQAGSAVSQGASRFRGIGDFLSSNKDNILDLASGAANTYDRYKSGQREDDLYNRDKSEWNRRAPLRDMGMKGMLDESRPDNSALFADPMSPQGRYRKVNVGSRG